MRAGCAATPRADLEAMESVLFVANASLRAPQSSLVADVLDVLDPSLLQTLGLATYATALRDAVVQASDVRAAHEILTHAVAFALGRAGLAPLLGAAKWHVQEDVRSLCLVDEYDTSRRSIP